MVDKPDFMTKYVNKTLIKRSRPRGKFLVVKTETSESGYEIQRNYCVNVLPKTNTGHFESLQTDNKILLTTKNCGLTNYY